MNRFPECLENIINDYVRDLYLTDKYNKSINLINNMKLEYTLCDCYDDDLNCEVTWCHPDDTYMVKFDCNEECSIFAVDSLDFTNYIGGELCFDLDT